MVGPRSVCFLVMPSCLECLLFMKYYSLVKDCVKCPSLPSRIGLGPEPLVFVNYGFPFGSSFRQWDWTPVVQNRFPCGCVFNHSPCIGSI